MTKKILIVAAKVSSIREPLVFSFKKLGYRVYWFDYRRSSFLEKIVFAPSLIYHKFWMLGNYLLNQRLLKFVNKINPDIVFVSKGETILKETVKKIKKNSIVINWYTDLFETIPRMVDILSEYDFVFTVDNYDTQVYKNHFNLFYMPFAASAPKRKINFKNRKYDVVFIGSWTQNREKLLSKLKEVKLYIWGNNRWFSSTLNKYYQGRWLTSNEILEVFSQTKITINERQNKKSQYTMPNYRLFEATANGVLVLTDYLKDLDKLFVLKGNNREMVLYQKETELNELVNFFLNNESERIKVAKRGYKRSLRDHLYEQRIKDILKIAGIKN